MVQPVGISNQFGTVNRLGQTEDGRVVYKIGDEQNSKTVSVASKDVDVFEKSYNDIITTLPKLQEFSQKSPQEMEKRKTLSKWVVGVPIAIGAGIPLITAKGSTLRQSLLTLGGAIVGAVVGVMASTSLVVPNGAGIYAKAMQNLSKIDIKPL